MPPKARSNSKNQKNQRNSKSQGKGDKNKPAPKKAVPPPKNPNPNSNFKPKKLKSEYTKKFEDKYQDYFQTKENKGEKDNEDFMFNKTPIMVSRETPSELQKSFNKKRKKIQQLKERKQKLVDIDDSDEEDFGFNASKKQQEEDDLFQDKGDAFFNSMKYGFTQYFMLDKNQEAMITKIPKLNLKEGTGILAAVSDKGPAGNYLEVSYGRNEKGYIARVDIAEEDQQQDAKLYNIGEYVQAVVVPGVNPKKIQLTLKPSIINKGLNFEDVFPGMVLQGKLDEEEDFGYRVNLFIQDKCIAFLKLKEEESSSINVNKIYLFHVTKVDKKKRVIQLSLFDNKNFPKIEADTDDMMGLDMSSVVKPGNLVNCTVSKVLENGLLVKFLKIFNGFIFQDYLQEPLSSYKIKQKLQARIILTNYESKQINLSQKQVHLDLIPSSLKNVEEKYQIGEKFTKGFLIKQCLFGNSFIVELENELKQKFDAFLKGKHVQLKEDLLKEGITLKKPLKIKGYNYFDQIPEVTAINDEIQKNELLWSNLEVGGYYNGVIGQIKQINNRYRILVQLSDAVKGIIDSNNISDDQLVIVPKHLQVNRKIKVRVLSVDRESKKLSLTIKPSLMEQDGSFITKFSTIEIGKQYTGYISKALDFGFIVNFFNDITGILTYADIEATNEFSRKSFKVGQSIEVYVSFVNPEEKKLGLTLSDKGIDNKKLANQQQKRVQSLLEKLPAIQNKDEQKTDNIFIGQKLMYTVDKQASENQTELLILKHKDNKHEQDHKAVVLKQHLSDYSEHYEPLFNYYKQNEANPKVQAIVIGKLENGYILVTFKPTIVNNPNHYKTDTKNMKKGDIVIGYADFQTKNGTIVKINEKLNGFAQNNEHFKANVNFADTLILVVKKIDQDKLYFQICNNLQIIAANLQSHPFINYLNEDFIINRKFINSNLKKWQKFRIGNQVAGKVSLIKEYGVILNITDQNTNTQITGFITNENLSQQKSKITVDQEIFAQILDIDYEKEIIDLKQISKQDFKANSPNQLNLEISKKNLEFLKNQKVSSTLLLKKDHYQICQVEIPENKEQVLVISEIKSVNQQNEVEIQEEFDENPAKRQEQQLQLQMINQQIFGKNTNDVQAHNKSHFLPIFTKIEKLGKNKENNNNNEMEIEEGEQKQNAEKSENKKIQSQLKEGGRISGEITSIKSNTYVLKITSSITARLHKNQVEENQLKTLKVGQTIEAKILNIKKEKFIQIELTTLEAHMKLGDGKLDQSIVLDLEPEQIVQKYQNQPISGVIKSIDSKSIKPIYIEFTHEHHGYISCFTGLANLDSSNLYEEVEKIKNLKQHYKVGQKVEVYVKKCENLKNIEVSFFKNQAVLDVGSISVGRIVGNNGKKMRLQIEPETFASVDITQISDEWVANPFQKYPKGSLVPFRIISQNVAGEFELSLRESFLNKSNWEKALSPQTGTTLNFKKLFKDQESSGDVRNRVYKLGPGCLKAGMIVIGYVNETNNNGCFVKIAQDLAVRAQLNELSDGYVAEPKSQFYKNKLVIARIIKIKEDGKIDISLRESVIKFGYSLSLDDFNLGQTVKGIVSGHAKGKAQVQLNNCKFRGQITLKELQVPEGEQGHKHNYIEVVLPKGTEIEAKVIQILKEPPILKLSTLQKHFEQYKNVQPKKEQEQAQEEILELIESIKQISAQNTEQEKRAADIQLQVQQQKQSLQEYEQEENDQEDYQFDESDEEDNALIQNTLKQANDEIEEENDEEDIEDEENFEEDEEDKINNLEELEDEEEGEEGEEEEDDEEEDKSKKLKKSDKRKLEEKIRKQEQKLLNDSAIPESEDDFEKLILKNPNSSYIWIKYIAFKMETSGIEEARTVIERAIKVINTTNQNQMLNVWTTYMNLEHNFGTESKLIEVFKRATQKCKPKDVYFRLLEIYKNTGKFDLILELSKNMIKKFKHSSKVWLEHMKNIQYIKQQYTEQGNTQEAEKYDLKEILKRALQVVKNKKHIIILTHYARIMYVQKQPEQGRTTFEAILQNYPKRTDIWSIYLDMETKYGNQQSTRNLYERCINMNFKLKQMKFFYKRYLQFEMQNGNEKEADLVKQKAQEYIQSLMPDNEDEEEADENQQQQNNNNNDMEEE